MCLCVCVCQVLKLVREALATGRSSVSEVPVEQLLNLVPDQVSTHTHTHTHTHTARMVWNSLSVQQDRLNFIANAALYEVPCTHGIA